MTMSNFAKHILAVAYENKLSVNNLQLQKVMYLSILKKSIKMQHIQIQEFMQLILD